MSTATLDTSISILGPQKIPSHLPYRTWADDHPIIPLYLDAEVSEDAPGGIVELEAAGPRQHLYFDPTRAKCAIVTCGGLCPGLNDVIRAIVMEAFHAYNVPAVMGIRYGLEGFIQRYGHLPMELTPAFTDVIVKRYIRITGKQNVRCVRQGRELSREEIAGIFDPDEEGGGQE